MGGSGGPLGGLGGSAEPKNDIIVLRPILALRGFPEFIMEDEDYVTRVHCCKECSVGGGRCFGIESLESWTRTSLESKDLFPALAAVS